MEMHEPKKIQDGRSNSMSLVVLKKHCRGNLEVDKNCEDVIDKALDSIEEEDYN